MTAYDFRSDTVTLPTPDMMMAIAAAPLGDSARGDDPTVNELERLAARLCGKDDALLLTPPIPLTLEYAVEFIADDELVEVTPQSIRIRKRKLKETDRKRASRSDAA